MVRTDFCQVQCVFMIAHSRSLLCFFLFYIAEAEAKAKEGEEDYKGESKFASHLKTGTGVSAFSKSRTLKEQREYLPAFACREELLKVIRDNQGVYNLPISVHVIGVLNLT